MTRIKLLSILAATALLAACETTPEESGSANASGSTTNSSSSSTAAAATTSSTPTSTAVTGPTPGSSEDFTVNVGDRIHFDTDKSDLDADARTTLERQAFWMRKFPSVTLTIEGHAGERGTREYNLALGERRASAARDYLVSLGIDPARLTIISYGKERPVALGSNEDSWSQNRRSVSVVN